PPMKICSRAPIPAVVAMSLSSVESRPEESYRVTGYSGYAIIADPLYSNYARSRRKTDRACPARRPNARGTAARGPHPPRAEPGAAGDPSRDYPVGDRPDRARPDLAVDQDDDGALPGDGGGLRLRCPTTGLG